MFPPPPVCVCVCVCIALRPVNFRIDCQVWPNTDTLHSRRKSDLCHGIDRNLTISTIHSSLVEHFRHFPNRRQRQIYYSSMGRVEARYDATIRSSKRSLNVEGEGEIEQGEMETVGFHRLQRVVLLFFGGGEGEGRRKGKARIYMLRWNTRFQNRIIFPFFLVEFSWKYIVCRRNSRRYFLRLKNRNIVGSIR